MERSCTHLKPGRTWPPRTPHGRLPGSQAKMITRCSTEGSDGCAFLYPRGEVNTPVIRPPPSIEIGSGGGRAQRRTLALSGTIEIAVPRRRLLPASRRKGTCGVCLWPTRPVFAGQDARAMPCSAGSGGAVIVRRMNAVMPTAMAPAIAKITCQVSDGMVSFTMPKVAW